MYVKQVSMHEYDAIENLFVSVFSKEPWNDDWSNKNQLRMYLTELIDSSNSLCFGLYDKERLIALSLGHVKHWYQGNEYYIDEFCVDSSLQHQGVGKVLISLLEEELFKREIVHFFLLTDLDVPAYSFYKHLGFHELVNNVAFTKRIEPYVFSRASQEEAKVVFDLVVARMKWMDEKKMQHWNVWEYDKIFPLSYYEKSPLFVLKKKNEVLCGCVLEEKEDSLYISHLVSKVQSGCGNLCMKKIEEYAKGKNFSYLRLDSSPTLVSFYKRLGFQAVDSICDGPYRGVVQEKKI